jgi:hypothetical protein
MSIVGENSSKARWSDVDFAETFGFDVKLAADLFLSRNGALAYSSARH